MSQTLYLYFIDSLKSLSSQSTIQWMLSGNSEENWQVCAIADLEQLQQDLQASDEPVNKYTLVIAVENALSTQVLLPGKQSKHLKQALPFLVEEKLAIDVDSMHLATGPRLPDNCYPVIAIERSPLQELLELLKTAGIEPELALTDAQLLQPNELYVGNTRSLLSLTSGQSIATSNQDLELIIDSAFNCDDALDSPDVPNLQVNYESEIHGDLELQLQALDSSQSAQVSIAVDPKPLGSIFREQLSSYNGINLLQGSFAPRKKKQQSQVSWKPFAVAASIILTLQLGYFVGSGIYFSNQADQVAADTEKLYRQYFPQDRRIRDIKRQAQAHLRGGKSQASSDFLTLLAALGENWQQPKHQSLQIEQVRYNAKRGQMTVEIQAKSINQLDALQGDIKNKGVKAELMSANETDNGVRGRLQLGG